MNPNCFVIMPINNPATEPLWGDVYSPIIQKCGFDADRIDVSEDGSDLSPQILQKIVSADLIIADLTMERQNCYFELGYAYGIPNKTEAAIIVCCREDHYHRSPNYKNDGPQVHFDLSGRNIIWWHDQHRVRFKTDLKLKIESRMKQIRAHQEIPETESTVSLLRSDLSLKTENGPLDQLENRLRKAQEELAKNA